MKQAVAEDVKQSFEKEKMRKSEQRRQKRLRDRLSSTVNGVKEQSVMDAGYTNGMASVKQSEMDAVAKAEAKRCKD